MRLPERGESFGSACCGGKDFGAVSVQIGRRTAMGKGGKGDRGKIVRAYILTAKHSAIQSGSPNGFAAYEELRAFR